MARSINKYKNTKIPQRIFRLKSGGDNFTIISQKISKEFSDDINRFQISELYDFYAAKSNVIANTVRESKREALQVNKEWNNEIEELVQLIRTKSTKHLEIADELLINAYDDGNNKEYFKNLPVAISLFRSLLDQINSLDNRFKKIELTQNNLILNETQIMQIVDKTFMKKQKETGNFIHPGTQDIVKLNI